VLRDEIRHTMREKAHELCTSTAVTDQHWSAWLQPHVVLSFCRMLHTLSTGRVGSKRAAGLWALTALDGRWGSLIQRALDDRPDPWLRVHRPADQVAVTETWAFLDYALQRSAMTLPS
jgi:hypothetical protein